MSLTGITPAAPSVERSAVEMCDGTAAELVRLSAGTLTASVLSFGATLVGLETPDSEGELRNCVLSLADPGRLAEQAVNPHLCGVVGPYANRIAGASFDLDGASYPLEANEGLNCLHGGSMSWDRRLWDIASLHADDTEASVTLTLIDPDGEGGFPGRVEATATYTLGAEGTLTLQIVCTTDRATVLAPTNHTYWNLSGSGTIADHRVSLSADLVLEVGPGQIPTARALPVVGGPWDLRGDVRLGDRLGSPELADLDGYDHTFLVDAGVENELPLVARLIDSGSGRTMEMRSDQPAVQVYTATHLDGLPGQHGPLVRHGALCLEAGRVPNGPNMASISGPDGPIPVDVTLRPGHTYRWTTSWSMALDGDASAPPSAPHG